MAAPKDYYKILGVPRNASSDDIKAAYWKLAQENHPDKNQGDSKKTEMFLLVNEANSVLSDAKKRGIYDRFGEPGLKPTVVTPEGRAAATGGGRGQQQGGDFFSGGDTLFGDFFESWFGVSPQEREAARQRAEEILRQMGEVQGGEWRVPRRDTTAAKPKVKFDLDDIKIPAEELSLMAGLMKVENARGATTIEHGNYRVKKDSAGNTRVEVKMSRFIKDGRVEVTVGAVGTFQSVKCTSRDWVDASWIDPMNVMGIEAPKNYRSLIGMVNQVALLVAHGGNLTDELIIGLNIAARVSFPDDHKREIGGDRLREELTTESRKWVPEGAQDEVKQSRAPLKESAVSKKPAGGVDFGKILEHRKRT